jgi:hypothetical protein
MRKLFAALAAVCLFVSPLTAQHQGRGGEINSNVAVVHLTLVVPESESMSVVPQDPTQPAGPSNPYAVTVSWNLEPKHTPKRIEVVYNGRSFEPQCVNDDGVTTDCRSDFYHAQQSVQITIPFGVSKDGYQNFELRIV